MPKFQGNRLKNTRGAIASSRIHAEFSLLKKVYDTSFVNPQILGTWGNNKLVCTLKFNILDTECNAKIIYNGLDAPKCWLINPVFNDPQHIYKDEGNLCLYDPKNNEWTSGSHIFNTFVPWSVEWVIFQMLYEETGEWQHPERHPGSMSDLELKEFCSKYGIPYNEEIKRLVRGT
ncbi:MAG: hypothetical protein OSJ56_10395 [Prevotella sp.]|jgi:hypothetical protein|uniref:hypothetical protein n=1 Tax=Muribaculum intestinale TaxID=1796646 RepID=UPI0025B719B1|nr:hypothetical protein [Muribaculum intestinale]MCX4294453.1 hypothetical protein [Prevotella sp.]